MKVSMRLAVAFFCIVSMAASAQTTVVYKLNGLKLTNGWTVTGTITTDGAIGTLECRQLRRLESEGGSNDRPRLDREG